MFAQWQFSNPEEYEHDLEVTNHNETQQNVNQKGERNFFKRTVHVLIRMHSWHNNSELEHIH